VKLDAGGSARGGGAGGEEVLAAVEHDVEESGLGHQRGPGGGRDHRQPGRPRGLGRGVPEPPGAIEVRELHPGRPLRQRPELAARERHHAADHLLGDARRGVVLIEGREVGGERQQPGLRGGDQHAVVGAAGEVRHLVAVGELRPRGAVPAGEAALSPEDHPVGGGEQGGRLAHVGLRLRVPDWREGPGGPGAHDALRGGDPEGAAVVAHGHGEQPVGG
jgi:hypothetical protein